MHEVGRPRVDSTHSSAEAVAEILVVDPAVRQVPAGAAEFRWRHAQTRRAARREARKGGRRPEDRRYVDLHVETEPAHGARARQLVNALWDMRGALTPDAAGAYFIDAVGGPAGWLDQLNDLRSNEPNGASSSKSESSSGLRTRPPFERKSCSLVPMNRTASRSACNVEPPFSGPGCCS